MDEINGIPADIILMKDGWRAINHNNFLFVLNRNNNNKSLQRPRTVYSLTIADPVLSPAEICDRMKHVTEYYKLYPWSYNKDLRASIYFALDSAKRDTGNLYKRLIKEWYKNREDKTINDIQFYKEIKAKGSRQMMDNDAELKDRIEITDNEKRFIWSISKDRKIKVMEIQEYRIESSGRKNSKFIVIADGYKFKLGIPIYSAKTKDECIDYIDKVTAEKDHNF